MSLAPPSRVACLTCPRSPRQALWSPNTEDTGRSPRTPGPHPACSLSFWGLHIPAPLASWGPRLAPPSPRASRAPSPKHCPRPARWLRLSGRVRKASWTSPARQELRREWVVGDAGKPSLGLAVPGRRAEETRPRAPCPAPFPRHWAMTAHRGCMCRPLPLVLGGRPPPHSPALRLSSGLGIRAQQPPQGPGADAARAGGLAQTPRLQPAGGLAGGRPWSSPGAAAGGGRVSLGWAERPAPSLAVTLGRWPNP